MSDRLMLGQLDRLPRLVPLQRTDRCVEVCSGEAAAPVPAGVRTRPRGRHRPRCRRDRTTSARGPRPTAFRPTGAGRRPPSAARCSARARSPVSVGDVSVREEVDLCPVAVRERQPVTLDPAEVARCGDCVSEPFERRPIAHRYGRLASLRLHLPASAGSAGRGVGRQPRAGGRCRGRATRPERGSDGR